MACEGWNQKSALNRLFSNPEQFDFFQAVKILQSNAAVNKRDIRFKILPSLSHSSNEISKLELAEGSGEYNLYIKFAGLLGPSSVLPNHYTEQVIKNNYYGDEALGEFFDIFNHRLIILLFNAWKRSNLPYQFELQNASLTTGVVTNTILSATIGKHGKPFNNRLQLSDNALLFYAGILSNATKNPISLRNLLSDYLQIPVVVEICKGQWLFIDDTEQTRCCSIAAKNCYNQLGQNSVLGGRYWDVQNKFRIKLGPLSYKLFLAYLPNSSNMRALTQLTRYYIGVELNFDVQLELLAGETPLCQLSKNQHSRLGWNSWLISSQPTTNKCDAIMRNCDNINNQSY